MPKMDQNVSGDINISSKSLSKTGTAKESPGPDPAGRTNQKFTSPTLLLVSQPRGPQDERKTRRHKAKTHLDPESRAWI